MIDITFISYHREATIPRKSKETGFYYLYPMNHQSHGKNLIVYDTGISVEIPSGFYMEIYPLDNLVERDLLMPSTPLIIKSNSEETIKLRFKCLPTDNVFDRKVASIYSEGEPIAKFMIKQEQDIKPSIKDAYEYLGLDVKEESQINE